ncbi:MAG: AraC family transcriptional regulator [Myxococcales bacterium]|nr:AraC family transcriptional regulator [Myxococcales bacterium]
MPRSAAVIPSLPAPKIAVVEGAFLYWTADTNLPHRPHLLKVYVPLGSPMLLSLPDHGTRLEFAGPLLVGPDVTQQVHLSGPRLTVFLEPETAGFRICRFLRRHAAPYLPLAPDLVAPLLALRPGQTWGPRLLNTLIDTRDRLRESPLWGSCEAPPKAILDVAARIVTGQASSREALAAAVGMSARALTASFREVTGLSLRRYGQWAKLTRAVAAAVMGVPFAETSAIAGFSDQAHFTRSTRALLGAVPSGIPFERALMRGNFYAGLGPRAADFLASLRPS